MGDKYLLAAGIGLLGFVGLVLLISMAVKLWRIHEDVSIIYESIGISELKRAFNAEDVTTR